MNILIGQAFDLVIEEHLGKDKREFTFKLYNNGLVTNVRVRNAVYFKMLEEKLKTGMQVAVQAIKRTNKHSVIAESVQFLG